MHHTYGAMGKPLAAAPMGRRSSSRGGRLPSRSALWLPPLPLLQLDAALCGSLHHVAKGSECLWPGAGLEAAVGVHPQPVWVAREHTRSQEGPIQCVWGGGERHVWPENGTKVA